MELRRVGSDWIGRAGMGAAEDRTISQTPAWLAFLRETQGGEIVEAEIVEDGQPVGNFAGLMVRRLGIRMLGSPLAGWGTPFMGFSLRPGVSRGAALAALERFAFGELGCWHLELRDRRLEPAEGEALGFGQNERFSFRTDLSASEDALFANMSGACRRCIRKAEREGVTIEEASPEGFAEEHYAQLVDVFAKQGMKPFYPVARVASLVRHLHPTGNLLLSRARDPEGRSIATGLSLGLGDWAFFWSMASWRAHQHLRPNEPLYWHAMRHWKSRGVRWFDWGGGGDYKRKYGVEEVRNPHFVKSRSRTLTRARVEGARLIRRHRNALERVVGLVR